MDSSQLWMWLEDLKWCPSQISYYFQDDTGKKWEIYLRWRHNDPWTAELIPLNNKWQEDYIDTWETLSVGYYKAAEYKALESDALNIVRSKFPEVVFPE